MDNAFWFILINKPNKSEEEKLLLELRHSLVNIQDILVSYDKKELDNNEALNNIKSIISSNIINLI